MCRNIRPLFNFDPPVTDDEIRAASMQFVRKITGFSKPSQLNESVFRDAVTEVAGATRRLMDALVTPAAPRDRELVAARAKARMQKRLAERL
ncbi:MAG: DUF2277 domain-containing protein [Candidatus Eremiobacteraeota bacterium]|nr:DUF2277 domain-containing protein [Candidatus Eremiobacteraeota bacterium]